MALFIKPSSFFLKFFALTLVFQVSVVWSAPSKRSITTDTGASSRRDFWIITDDTPSIDGDEQTAPAYYILAQKSCHRIYKELQEVIRPLDPVENAEVPNPPTDLNKLVQQQINTFQTDRLPSIVSIFHSNVFIPGIPPRILHGATAQAIGPRGDKELIITLVQAEGDQHKATVTKDSNDNYQLVKLAGQLPGGRPYILSGVSKPLSEVESEKLDQLRRQRHKQEKNNNHPESTDGSSGDKIVEDNSECPEGDTITFSVCLNTGG